MFLTIYILQYDFLLVDLYVFIVVFRQTRKIE